MIPISSKIYTHQCIYAKGGIRIAGSLTTAFGAIKGDRSKMEEELLLSRTEVPEKLAALHSFLLRHYSHFCLFHPYPQQGASLCPLTKFLSEILLGTPVQ